MNRNKINTLTLLTLVLISPTNIVFAQETEGNGPPAPEGILDRALKMKGFFTERNLPKADISPFDYKPPVSQASDLRLDFKYDFASKDDKVTANTGNLNSIYTTFYSSLPYAWSVNFNGNASLNNDIFNYATTVVAQGNKYFFENENDFFGFGRFNGSYNKSFNLPATNLVGGVGYGRFFNVTSLYKASRINDFLMLEHIIDAPMAKESLIALAQIIDREQEFKDKYSNVYEPRWYEAMEEAVGRVGKDDFSLSNLGAAGILRMKQVLTFESVQDRFIGWDVTSGIGFDLTTSDPSISNEPVLDLGARFSYPIGWDLQFNERLSVNTPITGNFLRNTSLNLTSDFTYELLDRVDVNIAHILTSELAPGVQNQLGNTLRGSLIFFLENQLNLVVTAQVDKSGDQPLNSSFGTVISYNIF